MSYIILKYDIDHRKWILHEKTKNFTGETDTVLFKTEKEALDEAEVLELEYEIYKFVRDSLGVV